MPIVDSQDSPLDEAMSERLSQRFISEDGLYLDTSLEMTPHLLISVDHMLDWFNHMEEIAGQPLGRRLAHASADHETWRQNRRTVPLPKGIFSKRKRISWLLKDWSERGLGLLSVQSAERIRVEKQIQSAMAGGQGAGAWEVLQGSRFRFRWEQYDASRTDIILEPDSRQAHPPRKVIGIWKDGIRGASKRTFPAVDTHDSGWGVDGRRCFMLGRDLILRLEDEILPHTKNKFDDGTLILDLEDDARIAVWNIFARAEKQAFIDGGEHIMIAETEHWEGVASTFFSRTGHGELQYCKQCDSHGGVELAFKSSFHPALLTGRLMACWQRAYGRQPRAEWRQNEGVHIIKVCSRHEIA